MTSDTPAFSDELLYMEFILQAICGGFVDMESTRSLLARINQGCTTTLSLIFANKHYAKARSILTPLQ